MRDFLFFHFVYVAAPKVFDARALAPTEEITEDQTRTRSQPHAMVCGIASAGDTHTARSRRQSNGTERNGSERNGTHPDDAAHQQTDTPTDRQTNETNRKRRRRQEHNTEGKEGKERKETTTSDERKEEKCGAPELETPRQS